jgi:hypothetical protein
MTMPNRDAIDDLAYLFWSIHPKDIPDAVEMPEGYKGGKRAWFYANQMRAMIAVAMASKTCEVEKALRNWQDSLIKTNYPDTAITVGMCADLVKTIPANLVEDAFRVNSRETFEAMCAMRDSINEYVPMPSLESDLLQGPENSVFCATVAEAVIAEIKRLSAALTLAPDASAIKEAALREAAATVQVGDTVQNIQRRILALITEK